MSPKRRFVQFTIGLTPETMHRLTQHAAARRCQRIEIVRTAIDNYLNQLEDNTERETIIAKSLRKIENRLATLTVLSTRASAQTLYLLCLPYQKGGFPPKPLKDEVFKRYWKLSRQFAGEYLKRAVVDLPSEHDLDANQIQPGVSDDSEASPG